MDPYQSAYRMQSSSETALLKVASDLYGGMDDGRVSILVTLDISAAFDTIDASILLERMEVYFGVTGRALQWLSSYLTQRRQCMKMDGVLSPVSMLPSGVPQGSVLGPVLFSAFIAPLADVIDSFHISHHQYADDTNLYHSFSASDQQSCLETVSECLNSVKNWFLTNGLLVNSGKSDSIYSLARQCRQVKLIALESIWAVRKFRFRTKSNHLAWCLIRGWLLRITSKLCAEPVIFT